MTKTNKYSMSSAVLDYLVDNIRLIVFATVVILGGVGLYVGYRWYDAQKQQEAQFAFGMALDQYNIMLEKENADFSTMAEDFYRGYEMHKNSSIAPYFLSYQADALIQAGKKMEALAAMDKAVDVFSSDKSLSDLMKTKRALLAMDSGDTTRAQQGLDELQLLAQNVDNSHRDYALYHVGMYHWVHNNVDSARIAWQELVDSQDEHMFTASPWASLVIEKLQSIA